MLSTHLIFENKEIMITLVIISFLPIGTLIGLSWFYVENKTQTE